MSCIFRPLVTRRASEISWRTGGGPGTFSGDGGVRGGIAGDELRRIQNASTLKPSDQCQTRFPFPALIVRRNLRSLQVRQENAFAALAAREPSKCPEQPVRQRKTSARKRRFRTDPDSLRQNGLPRVLLLQPERRRQKRNVRLLRLRQLKSNVRQKRLDDLRPAILTQTICMEIRMAIPTMTPMAIRPKHRACRLDGERAISQRPLVVTNVQPNPAVSLRVSEPNAPKYC